MPSKINWIVMRCVSYIFIDGNSILRWVEKRKMVCCWFRKQVSTENEIRNALARALLYLLMLPSLTNEDLFLLQGHLRKLRLFPYANMSEIYTTTSRMYKIDNHWMSMHWLRSRKKQFCTKTASIHIKYFVCLQILIRPNTIMYANFA